MGTLVGIYIADSAANSPRSIEHAQFVAGMGIVGDRYFAGTGQWSPAVQEPKYEVTLIEIEEVTLFNSEHGAILHPGELRRNLVTNGIRLNDLVGADFSVGNVVLRGIKLCEPCEYLAGLTHPDVLSGLLHRAGLRASIVKGGAASLGDLVTVQKNA